MIDAETIHVATAAASLNDKLAARNARLAEIERALKLDPDRDYRRQLVREFLDLTDPQEADFL